jgi:hypothetical protein
MVKYGTKMLCLGKIGLAFFVFFLISFPSLSPATTIRAVTFEELLKYSEFVFEGRVIAVESGVFPSSQVPRTWVLFEIIEILKGTYSDDTVNLCFMGGVSGGYTVQVAGMQYPKLGEKGIYFVKSLTRQYAHPLCGWKQGHFLLETDPYTSREHVMTADRQPVTGISLEKAPLKAPSAGVARGVKTAESLQTEETWTAEKFKQNLRTMLEAMK